MTLNSGLEAALADAAHFLRLVRRHPSFPVGVAASLALGIGFNAVVSSVSYDLLHRPLPFREEDRLVVVYESVPTDGMPPRSLVPFVEFEDWKRARPFEALAARIDDKLDVTLPEAPRRIRVAFVTPDYFEVLGVASDFIGRDWAKGVSGGCLISHRLWRSQLGGGSRSVPDSLGIGRLSLPILGVLPSRIDDWDQADLFLPISSYGNWRDVDVLTKAGFYSARVIGRLHRQVSVEQAEGEMSRLAQSVARARTGEAIKLSAVLVKLRDDLVGDEPKRSMVLIQLMAGILLIASCANAFHLLVVNLSSRETELATRVALGASRGRIVRQMLTEALVLAIPSGLAGLLLSLGTLRVIEHLLSGALAPLALGAIAVLGLLLAASVGFVLGGLGAMRVLHSKLATSLRNTTTPGSSNRLGSMLVAIQVALSIVLVASAGLILARLYKLTQARLGFDPRGVAVVQLAIPSHAYSVDTLPSVYESLEAAFSSLPGVVRVGLSSEAPIPGSTHTRSITLDDGRRFLNGSRYPTPGVHSVNAGYLAALEIPLLAGAPLTAATAGGALISKRTASTYWPDVNAVGKRFRLSGEGAWIEVIGVTGDVRHGNLDSDVKPEIYLPLRYETPRELYVFLKVTRAPQTVALEAERRLQETHGLLPVIAVNTMEGLISKTHSTVTAVAATATLFGLACFVLAVSGVHSLVSFTVALRQREIAIRLALGAPSRAIVVLLAKDMMAWTAAGMLGGCVLAWSAGAFLRHLVVGMDEQQTVALVLTVGVLAASAGLAAYLPCTKALRIELSEVLRCE